MLPIGEYFTSFLGRQFHEGGVAERNVRSLMTKPIYLLSLPSIEELKEACNSVLSLKVLVFSKTRSPTMLSFSFHFRFLDLWVKHSIFAFVWDNTIGRDVIFLRPVKIIVISYKIWLT